MSPARETTNAPTETGVLVMRAARASDLDGLYDLALAAGAGMTNLPPDRDALAARLAASAEAWASPDARASGRGLMFILDLNGHAVGTALIIPRIGIEWPFYSYRRTRQTQSSKVVAQSVSHELLVLANDFDGEAEVGGLFVQPGLRGLRAGRLAARSRYLFMARHREWFGRRVISELRGWLDTQGSSPVWEALGREFYGMDFVAADQLNALSGNQFIADLAPRHPIYVGLLPQAAREAVGRPHDDGRQAMALLSEEGFRDDGYADIFDGGPTLVAEIDTLAAVRGARLGSVVAIDARAQAGHDALIAAGFGEAFRAVRGPILVDDDGAVSLTPDRAEALNLSVGDPIIHTPF